MAHTHEVGRTACRLEDKNNPGFFSSIGHLFKEATHVVANVAKDVAHVASSAVKSVENAVKDVAEDVGHVAATATKAVVHETEHVVKEAVKTGKEIAHAAVSIAEDYGVATIASLVTGDPILVFAIESVGDDLVHGVTNPRKIVEHLGKGLLNDAVSEGVGALAGAAIGQLKLSPELATVNFPALPHIDVPAPRADAANLVAHGADVRVANPVAGVSNVATDPSIHALASQAAAVTVRGAPPAASAAASRSLTAATEIESLIDAGGTAADTLKNLATWRAEGKVAANLDKVSPLMSDYLTRMKQVVEAENLDAASGLFGRGSASAKALEAAAPFARTVAHAANVLGVADIGVKSYLAGQSGGTAAGVSVGAVESGKWAATLQAARFGVGAGARVGALFGPEGILVGGVAGGGTMAAATVFSFEAPAFKALEENTVRGLTNRLRNAYATTVTNSAWFNSAVGFAADHLDSIPAALRGQ